MIFGACFKIHKNVNFFETSQKDLNSFVFVFVLLSLLWDNDRCFDIAPKTC